MNLKKIKSKIISVRKIGKVTQAMEAVSAVKMRKSQEKALSVRPYATSALKILKRLSSGTITHTHPLIRKRKIENIALVLITSDKGLAGSLNSSLLKTASLFLREKNIKKENVEIFCIGKKGYEFFTKRGFITHLYDLKNSEEEARNSLRQVRGHLTTSFLSGSIDAGYVVYTNFKSTLIQVSAVRQILPLDSDILAEIVASILPEKGRYSKDDKIVSTFTPQYTFEPSPEDVLEKLIPFLMDAFIYHTLLESLASEHSARMVAMKNAGDRAVEVGDDLTLHFNKARQTAITGEVLEIISGAQEVEV